MYSYKNEQRKLDVIKWNESMKTGEDKCGSYLQKGRGIPLRESEKKRKQQKRQGARCRSESVTEKNRSGGEK